MEVSYPVKLKRKELEDEFSDFSLSSPATKFRRLDSESRTIVEEQEPDISIIFSQSQPLTESNCFVGQGGGDSVVIEEFESSLPVNEERAIVLFNPMDTPLLHSPSPYSFSISPNFTSSLKNQVLWSSQSNLVKAADSETEKKDVSNGCLAVVPWVPTHSQPATTQQLEDDRHADMCEKMEADETGVESMDVEENYIGVNDQMPGSEFVRMSANEGLNPWQYGPQQHCMIPQPPQNLSTPVTWFR